MKLTIEASGEIHTMEVYSFGRTGLKQEGLPEEASGARMFNKMWLRDKDFNEFIDAMMIDDFGRMKAVIDRLIDHLSRDLAFKDTVRIALPAYKGDDYF